MDRSSLSVGRGTDTPVGLTAWERSVVRRDGLAPQVKHDIAESWRRCLDARIDPMLSRAPRLLGEDALFERRAQPWVRLAEEVLAPHLESVASCGHVLTMFDASGCMLSSAGAPRTLEQLEEIRFTPGASWDEAEVGTNGPGTALALGRSIHVVGAEHFCAAWHRWHCAAVPLFDPDSHALLGALDISGAHGTAHPYILSLVTALARSVEQALALDAQRRRARLLERHVRPAPTQATRAASVAAVPARRVTRYGPSDLIGSHPRLDETRRMAQLASQNVLPVLLLGESGTGKEVVAQAIHAASARAARPFVAVNCGALPAELLESELFGYVAGAFTGAQRSGAKGKFEAADGGTLLLDEICELPLSAQAKLLRVVQEQQVTRVGATMPRSVDVRVIAATNRDPRAEIAAGRFRLDLFYRLDVLEIALPPLRARGDDVLVLARRFLASAARETGRHVSLAPEVEQVLRRHAWPGNVRELENLMRRLSATSAGATAQLSDLPPELRDGATASGPSGREDDPHKRELMAVVRGARTMAEAARHLGVTRSTLYRRLERFGLRPARWVGERSGE